MRRFNDNILFIQTILSFLIVVTGIVSLYVPDFLILTQSLLTINMLVIAYNNLRQAKTRIFAISYVLMSLMCLVTVIMLVVRG